MLTFKQSPFFGVLLTQHDSLERSSLCVDLLSDARFDHALVHGCYPNSFLESLHKFRTYENSTWIPPEAVPRNIDPSSGWSDLRAHMPVMIHCG